MRDSFEPPRAASAASTALDGYDVRLEPLAEAHADALLAAAADGALWTLNYTSVPGPDLASVREYVRIALEGRTSGTMLPFVVVASGRVVGCTRYYDIDPSVPTLAIGYTWYVARAQRTHVNSACKRLLLGHAFETLGVRSVYFHTSHLNLRSQAAIERLGARRDGLLRQHKRHRDGGLRDTVVYSILHGEWPECRRRLDARLRSGDAAVAAPAG